MSQAITYTHRLILPVDANHHGTLYAGSLLRIALEAAYATAFARLEMMPICCFAACSIWNATGPCPSARWWRSGDCRCT